jgi:hypothetical protein
MHDWSSYWPAPEYWLSWPSIIPLIGALLAVAIGFVRSASDRIIGLGLLAIVVWYSTALASSQKEKPEHDYTFLLVDPQQAQVVDGKVKLFSRSTGTMDGVRICFSHTGDYQSSKYLDCRPPLDFDQQKAAFGFIPMGDYTIDIDGKTRLGKVRQRLDLVENHGRAIAVLSRVQRKETGEVVCETPPHGSVKPCT